MSVSSVCGCHTARDVRSINSTRTALLEQELHALREVLEGRQHQRRLVCVGVWVGGRVGERMCMRLCVWGAEKGRVMRPLPAPIPPLPQ